MNGGQYGLTYIAHLEIIDQFKAHRANADQQKISTELYSPFKDFTLVFIKRFFLLIEIFLKNFNHGQ